VFSYGHVLLTDGTSVSRMSVEVEFSVAADVFDAGAFALSF
jgi:hypothetical protein